MQRLLLLIANVFLVVENAPSPIELPLSQLPAYYAAKEKDGGINLAQFGQYVQPPDLYPAIIPSPNDDIPDFYDDNLSYPLTLQQQKGCESLKICPDETGVPDGYGLGGFVISQIGNREWKCHFETDCFGLGSIPPDVKNTTDILFMEYANFTELRVGDLSSLPPLIKFRLGYSYLETIQPGAFAGQENLEYLELVENYLKKLQPSTFFELKNLIELDLTGNELLDIQRSTFEGLASVTELKIGENELTEIHNYTFREMPNLQLLELGYNNITTIAPLAFAGLEKLSSLHLNHNFLKKIPNPALRKLTFLNNFYMTGNILRNIYRSDFKSLRLKSIWLDQCGIESFEKRTFGGKNLTYLDISDNKISHLNNLGNIGSHALIKMDWNPWMCDGSLTKMLKWLKRYNIQISHPEPVCFSPYYLKGRLLTRLTTADLNQTPPPSSSAPSFKTKDQEEENPEEGNSNYQWYSDSEETIPQGTWNVDPFEIEQISSTPTTDVEDNTEGSTNDNSESTANFEVETTTYTEDRFLTTRSFSSLSMIGNVTITESRETSTHMKNATTKVQDPSPSPDNYIDIVVSIMGVVVFLFLIIVVLIWKLSADQKKKIKKTVVELNKINKQSTKSEQNSTRGKSTQNSKKCDDGECKKASLKEKIHTNETNGATNDALVGKTSVKSKNCAEASDSPQDEETEKSKSKASAE